MKSFLKILFILIVLISLLYGGDKALVYRNGNALDNQSREYAETVLPKMLSNLTEENLKSFLDDVSKSSNYHPHAQKVLALYQKLGAFKTMSDLRGDATIHVNPSGQTITALYTANAQFESGPSQVTLTLIKREDKWSVLSFEIKSMVLPTSLSADTSPNSIDQPLQLTPTSIKP